MECCGDDQIREDEVGGACSTHAGNDKLVKKTVREPEGKR
jgi:hypothetical protein